MHFKKHLRVIRKNIAGMWLRLKGVLLIPIVFFCILLPILNRYDILYPNSAFAAYNMDKRMLYILSISVLITTVYVLHPYVEGDGRELLFLNKNYAKLEFINIKIINILLMTVIFFMTYTNVMPLPLLAYVKYLLIILFYGEICFTGMFTICSTAMGMFPALIVLLCSVLGKESVFLIDGLYTWNYENNSYLPQMIILLVLDSGLLYYNIRQYGIPFQNISIAFCTDPSTPVRVSEVSMWRKKRKRIKNIFIQGRCFYPLSIFADGIVMSYIIYCLSSQVNSVYFLIQNINLMVMPISLLIMGIMLFYPYLAGEGRELLYIRNTSSLLELWCIVFWHLILSYGTGILLYRTLTGQWLNICLQNTVLIVFFAALLYGLSFFSKKITSMIIMYIIIYLIMVLNLGNVASVFYDTEAFSVSEVLADMSLYMKASLLLLIVGCCCRKNYSCYS